MCVLISLIVERLSQKVSLMGKWEADIHSNCDISPREHIIEKGKVTARRVDWPLPGTEITGPKQVFQSVIFLLFSLVFLLYVYLFLPLSFNSGLVLSSLKACPHAPSSSHCSLNRSLARCFPSETRAKKHTQKNNNTPRSMETHLHICSTTVDVQCDCNVFAPSTLLYIREIKTMHFPMFFCFPSH